MREGGREWGIERGREEYRRRGGKDTVQVSKMVDTEEGGAVGNS